MDTEPASDEMLARQVAQACHDLERRLVAGESCAAEEWLAACPALAARPEYALELIYAEFVVRGRLGQQPSEEEWYNRFPQWRADLRQLFQVHRLAGAEQEDSGTVIDPPDTSPRARSGLPPGSRIGNYELLAEIGRGGMGVVYRARQLGLNRTVALKMILAGDLAGQDEVRRFLREAEAIAQLQHPHIVQIYEVGEHQGRPYLALEYVAGGSLAQMLAAGPLPARLAADLVQTLAQAIQHAHQRGVVHRDLKPANILLTTEAQRHREDNDQEKELKNSSSLWLCASVVHPLPKITDFGLAKRLNVPGDSTRTGAIVGTPSYMAPEQAAGRAREVGPAADVYALGMILYELLTGRPAFVAATALETLEQVRNQEPVPPTQLQPRVPRDLETITLKCLEKDAARRYPSARALAEDVERFQAGEPIRARPVGPAERLWRWCRRRPAVAGLLATLALVLVVGLASVTFLWRRAEHLREEAIAKQAEAETNLGQANENFDLARRAVDQCFTLASETPLLRKPGMQRVRELLLRPALIYYQEFVRKRRDDPAVQEELGRNYLRLASISELLGKDADALAAAQEAAAIWEALARADPGNRAYPANLASAYNTAGERQVITGKRAEALESYQRARALLEPLLERDPGVAEYQYELARAYHNMGYLQYERRDLAAALSSYERAQFLWQPLAQRHPGIARYRHGLVRLYLNLGSLHRARGVPSAALEAFGQAREQLDQLTRTDPAADRYQVELAGAYYQFAYFHHLAGDVTAALPPYEQARGILEQLVRENPDVIDYQSKLAGACTNLGTLYQAVGDGEASLRSYVRAGDLLDKLMQSHPTVSQYQTALASTSHNLGVLQHSRGGPAAARRSFAKAMALDEKLIQSSPGVPRYQDDLADTCLHLAAVEREAGKPAEALQLCERARAMLEIVVRQHSGSADYQADLAHSYQVIGQVRRDTGELPAAQAVLEQARTLLEKLVREHPKQANYASQLASVLDDLGLTAARAGRLQEACLLHRDAIGRQRLAREAQPRVQEYQHRLGNHYQNLATVERQLGRRAEAVAATLERQRLWPKDPALLYEVAGELALCIPLAGQEKSELTAEQQAERRSYADLAMTALGQAVAAGFKDLDRIKKDRNLEPLRPRADFRKLLGDLETVVRPTAR
jgi:serine/threonine protein kinase/tetratricopeptide (TPR) repeat protein